MDVGVWRDKATRVGLVLIICNFGRTVLGFTAAFEGTIAFLLIGGCESGMQKEASKAFISTAAANSE